MTSALLSVTAMYRQLSKDELDQKTSDGNEGKPTQPTNERNIPCVTNVMMSMKMM